MTLASNSSKHVTDIALMLRVRGGDEEAYAALYERHHRKVLDFFYGMGRNPHSAEDLCQETFLRIWKLRHRYAARGSFTAYLFAFARYIWLEQLRKTRRLQTFTRLQSGAQDGAGLTAARFWIPDEAASHAELEARIWEALQCLPDEQRMAFVLRVIHNLPLDEIASIMECPVNTVRSRKLLAIKKIRHALREILVL